MAQFFRFCVNGGVSAGIHYGVYVLMMQFIQIDIAYSIGYVVSFVYNFFLTCYWTFHARPTWMRLVGFSGSHVVNYLIHVVLFHLLTVWGVHRLIAPVLVLMVAVWMMPLSVIYALALMLLSAHYLPFPMMRVMLGISYYRIPF